jgi:putative ABC transport system permease protein
MNWNDLRLRLRALVFRRRTEQDLADEFGLHIEMETRSNVRQGMNETDARRRALIKFGGTASAAEECRDERRVRLVEHFIQDVRFAVRIFARSPVFTVVAILLLALGIGATTTVFSLAYRVIQESLPVRHPDELVELYNEDRVTQRFQAGFSHPAFQLFRQKNQVFSATFAFSDTFKVDVTRKGTAEFAEAVFQTTGMDSVLGLRPALGRLINDGDGQAGANSVAVVSFRYWQKRFGGDPNVIGETISINNTAFVIVGVAPRGFQGMIVGVSPDVILPMPVIERVRRVPVLNNGASLGLHLIGRRKPGLTMQQIQDSVEPLYRSSIDLLISSVPAQFAESLKGSASKWQLRIQPALRGANSDVQAELQQPLAVLISITTMVFLIGCINLGGLFITRTEVRMKELSTRLAIGCSRGRLIRQMVTESMLLAVAGGVAGLAISFWMGPVLLGLLTSRASTIDITLHPMTPFIASALSILAGSFLGLASSLTAYRVSDHSLSKKMSRYSWSGGKRLLLIGQVAVLLVLLVVAGQFALTLGNYRKLTPGFRPDHLVLFDVSVRTRPITYVRELRERLSQIPGVISVTHSLSPVGQVNWRTPIQIKGFQPPSPGSNWADRNIVGARFVETLGLQLISGRDVAITDTRDRPSVAVVNQAFADFYFKGQNPIGRTFSFIDSLSRQDTIVGVVQDARDRGIKTPASPVVYSSFEHDPLGGMTFAVRVARESNQVMPEIASVVRELDPSVPLGQMRSMESQIDESLLRERMLASLSSTFAGLASLVAAIGIYGMLAYMVTRRTREIAVRIALGARPGQIGWVTLRESLIPVLIGTILGIPLSVAMSSAAHSQLFGVESMDARAMSVAIGVVVGVAAFASLLPARRAARIDAIVALKYE